MLEDIKLIEEIKNHPLLYDPGVPENRDMNAKESTWDFIAKSLGYSVRECKMRWKSLRERFARERKKIIMNNDEYGSEEDPDLEPKAGQWHLMKHMSFLWNFVIHRNINRSKGMYLNSTHDEQSNNIGPIGAPIWLLPNITNNNILQALQPKAVAAQDEEPEEYEGIAPGKVKDPLCVDEDNTLCFNIDSSDSERESVVSKRAGEDDCKSEKNNPVKKRRKDAPVLPASPVAAALNEVSKSNDRFNRSSTTSTVSTNREKTHPPPQSSQVPLNNDDESSSVEMTNEQHHKDTVKMERYDKSVNTYPSLPKTLPQSYCDNKNEDELFCLSIAASMQRLTAKQRALLKLRIQKVMYEVEFPE